MKLIMIQLLVFLLLFQLEKLNGLQLDDYQYAEKRFKLHTEEDNSIEKFKLNHKEKVVDTYLQILKSKEFNQNSKIYYGLDKHISEIQGSNLYRELRNLPKGANLHLHDFQIIDRLVFLEWIKNSTEFDYLYICDDMDVCKEKRYYLNYYHHTNVPKGWSLVKESNLTMKQIADKTVFIGMLNELDEKIHVSDSATRWTLFKTAFACWGDIFTHNNTLFGYLKLVMDAASAEHVQLLEIRTLLFQSWYFDLSGEKVYIDGKDTINAVNSFRQGYLANNKNMIDLVFIILTMRSKNKDSVRNDVTLALELHELYPDLIRGYDLVGEEDDGYSLLTFREHLIDGFNRINEQPDNDSFKYFFHAAETNWPEDVQPLKQDDVLGALENIYDAIVFRTRRIGHGLGIFKHPFLYEIIRERQIAIEVCPSSNNLLGYVPDLRNHPGINYYRSGLPMVLSGDDPGTFGYNELTLEFYIAFTMWGFKLDDLKQLAWNSIRYSSIKNETKTIGFEKWAVLWENYINDTYSLVCNKSNDVDLSINDITPMTIPRNMSQNVVVYGHGFEKGLCKRIACLFSDTHETVGQLVTATKILCSTPDFTNSTYRPKFGLKIDETLFETDFYFNIL